MSTPCICDCGHDTGWVFVSTYICTFKSFPSNARAGNFTLPRGGVHESEQNFLIIKSHVCDDHGAIATIMELRECVVDADENGDRRMGILHRWCSQGFVRIRYKEASCDDLVSVR